MSDYKILLDLVTKNVQKRITEMGDTKVKGTDFEKIVYDELLKAGVSEDAITHSTQKFPDFVIDDNNVKIGVEVKKTDADKWDVPGGSIYESLRNSIETFVLMGKFGGTPEARLRKYEECISDLTVTHSPRFHLNLDMDSGEDYLTRHNASDLLDLPKGKELNRRIRELLRTDKDTWYTEESVGAYSNLSLDEKICFFVDGVVLFPEVTGMNYSNFAPWMIYKCLIWCSNIRDVFSAGGTKDLDDFAVSAVMARILETTDLIVKRIADMTKKEIKTHWGIDEDISFNERIERWIGLIHKHISISQKLIKKNKKNHPELLKYKRKKNYSAIIREKFIAELREQMNRSVSEFTAKRRINRDNIS